MCDCLLSTSVRGAWLGLATSRIHLIAADDSSKGSSSYIELAPGWYSGFGGETAIEIKAILELNSITGIASEGSISTEGNPGDMGSISMSTMGSISISTQEKVSQEWLWGLVEGLALQIYTCDQSRSRCEQPWWSLPWSPPCKHRSAIRTQADPWSTQPGMPLESGDDMEKWKMRNNIS